MGLTTLRARGRFGEGRHWPRSAPLGAGIEYFLGDDISIGVEFTYLFAGNQTLTVGGVAHKFNPSTPLTSFRPLRRGG